MKRKTSAISQSRGKKFRATLDKTPPEQVSVSPHYFVLTLINIWVTCCTKKHAHSRVDVQWENWAYSVQLSPDQHQVTSKSNRAYIYSAVTAF